MSEANANFHQFALHSSLFKGRSDWYFCYLKAEKIAHVLIAITGSTGQAGAPSLQRLLEKAAELPEAIARMAAGELAQESALADVFALLSAVRLAQAAQDISSENALLIGKEYERVAQKIGIHGRPSPFISSEDFSVPQPGRLAAPQALSRTATEPVAQVSIKDKDKGHSPSQASATASVRPNSTEKEARAAEILAFIRSKPGASIKEITTVVKGYGEKTIQRELGALIAQGLIRKEGERRWSVYKPVSGIDQTPPIR